MKFECHLEMFSIVFLCINIFSTSFGPFEQVYSCVCVSLPLCIVTFLFLIRNRFFRKHKQIGTTRTSCRAIHHTEQKQWNLECLTMLCCWFAGVHEWYSRLDSQKSKSLILTKVNSATFQLMRKIVIFFFLLDQRIFFRWINKKKNMFENRRQIW